MLPSNLVSTRGASIERCGLLLGTEVWGFRVFLTVRRVELRVVIRRVGGAGWRVFCVVKRVSGRSLVIRIVDERCFLRVLVLWVLGRSNLLKNSRV